MLVYNTANNPNFINFLKKFERDISDVHWKVLRPSCTKASQNLKILFNSYLDINNTTVEEINILLQEVDKYTHNRQVKNLIISELIYLLRYESENYNNNIIGEAITKKHLFGMS
jgi:hypothetical protein